MALTKHKYSGAENIVCIPSMLWQNGFLKCDFWVHIHQIRWGFFASDIHSATIALIFWTESNSIALKHVVLINDTEKSSSQF